MTPETEALEETMAHSRRSFLTRTAVGAGAAVVGGAALTALSATPAAAATVLGDPFTVFVLSPVRAFDSRVGQPHGGTGTQGILTKGNPPRLIGLGIANISLGDIVPDDAFGVFINIAITNTVSTGALGITRGSDSSPPTASAINWFGPSQILANGLLVPISSASGTGDKSDAILPQINVHCIAGTNGVSAAHFIIDIGGWVWGP